MELTCYDEPMNNDIRAYHANQVDQDKQICDALYKTIAQSLPKAENKVWRGHPVWFLDGNPIVGYSKLKNDVRVLFWSGQSFDEPGLSPEGSFKAAEIRYTDASQINHEDLRRYIDKATHIQWDYKNIIKNKGVLHRIG